MNFGKLGGSLGAYSICHTCTFLLELGISINSSLWVGWSRPKSGQCLCHLCWVLDFPPSFLEGEYSK